MTITTLQKDKIQHNGEYGNSNILHGRATLNEQAIAGVANALRVPAGTKVYGIRVPHGAFGDSVTIGIGYAPVDADDGPTASATYFLAQTAAATAGVLNANAFVPIRFDYDVYITLTTAGAETTDSDIHADVIVEAVYEGTK